MPALNAALIPPPAAAPIPGTKVLILDDDAVTRTILTHTLAAAGYQTVEAGRISAALKLMETLKPDLIIVDGLLPDGMGVKFVEEVRKAGLKVPVIFFSSFFRDNKSIKFLRENLRVSDVLIKPLTPEKIMERVRRIMTGEDEACPTPPAAVRRSHDRSLSTDALGDVPPRRKPSAVEVAVAP